MSVSGDKLYSHVKAVSTFHYSATLFSYAIHPGEKCSKMLGMVEDTENLHIEGPPSWSHPPTTTSRLCRSS